MPGMHVGVGFKPSPTILGQARSMDSRFRGNDTLGHSCGFGRLANRPYKLGKNICLDSQPHLTLPLRIGEGQGAVKPAGQAGRDTMHRVPTVCGQ
jgi:hypothetical protein